MDAPVNGEQLCSACNSACSSYSAGVPFSSSWQLWYQAEMGIQAPPTPTPSAATQASTLSCHAARFGYITHHAEC